jgi:hypothetical protein
MKDASIALGRWLSSNSSNIAADFLNTNYGKSIADPSHGAVH